MYTEKELSKMVFFDLETASTYPTLVDLEEANPRMAELWIKRCDYLRSRFEENREKSNDELYIEKAALTPEFSRIVCASFGRLALTEDPVLGTVAAFSAKSYASKDEAVVLAGIHKVFESFSDWKFVGHNIKRFDVPMMCKRLLMSGKSLPKGLQIQNLKPWEMPFIDTSEVWSFGAWQEGFASLELLATSLGLETPKGDIRGEDVGRVFWQEGDIDRIAAYCQRDIQCVANVVLKLSGLSPVEDLQLQDT
jgi:DNA polymerase III epsilon subunit-like protein